MSEPSRPSVLWKQMSAERRMQAAEAFWRDPNGGNEQAEAIATIAMRLKFRPRSVLTLSVERKSRYLVGLPAVSELVAARLLVAYHIQRQRPMMAAFLDALGIKHDDGLIDDEQVQSPGEEKLRAAAARLAASFPAEDVALYLSTLTWQDPEAWGSLSDVPESRIAAEA
ncbi:MAG: hypothetical protein ABL971_05455 [Vicinamibacterales bacterium]